MKIRQPAYYDSFSCMASACPDSCCKEWEVEIDEDTASLYRNLPGPLGDRLRQVLKDDPQWGTVMTIENGRCPMWQTDGLCRIQRELGHDALCKTCRNFPRLCHDYGDFQEWGLELSCPEAARMILSSDHLPLVEAERSGGETPDYDCDAMTILLQTREKALELLLDVTYSVPQALTLLLFYGHQAQALLDGQIPPEFAPEEILKNAKDFAVPGGERDILAFFSRLEILTPQWQVRLSQPYALGPWTAEFRRLARYFLERYWLQAVSDYDLISRVKLAVLSCIVVYFLGGNVVETAQLYSKEIENSPENVDAILDALYTSPVLTDQRLLGLLYW